MARNTWLRKSLAIAAVALLSVPSAVGVQRALAPTRGAGPAWLAAAGFEAVYLATALLVLSADLRRFAHRVALSAVITAVSLNTLADYAHRVPGGLASWQAARRLFDPLALTLSLAESLPLAALAFAMATLLHRIAEHEARPPAEDSAPFLSVARQEDYPAPVEVHDVQAEAEAVLPITTGRTVLRPCPHCGAPLSMARYAAAVRYGHCRHCKSHPE